MKRYFIDYDYCSETPRKYYICDSYRNPFEDRMAEVGCWEDAKMIMEALNAKDEVK